MPRRYHFDTIYEDAPLEDTHDTFIDRHSLAECLSGNETPEMLPKIDFLSHRRPSRGEQNEKRRPGATRSCAAVGSWPGARRSRGRAGSNLFLVFLHKNYSAYRQQTRFSKGSG